MGYTKVKSGFFLAERKKKLEHLNSKLLQSTVDFIQASLWLIAGNQLAQALVMLDNAIEVALKGELERIHRILIADRKSLGDFKALKSLLRDAFMMHPSGNSVEIPDFDIERTIYFDEAFDRVAELHPGLSANWRKRLMPSKGGQKESLHALRNDIVHYGGDPNSSERYMVAIVDIAFPFLEELFNRITGNTVSLPHLLMEGIYREAEVARNVLHDLRNENATKNLYAIKTLQHHTRWTFDAQPSPSDDLDVIEISGKTKWEKYVERQRSELFKIWDDSLSVEIPCPVCDSKTGDGSYVQAQVLLEKEPVDDNQLIAEGFNCFICGLRISPEERFLARHFVGQIPENISTVYLKDIGHL
jgi:hypothetical protein